jgi:hypothetical protein
MARGKRKGICVHSLSTVCIGDLFITRAVFCTCFQLLGILRPTTDLNQINGLFFFCFVFWVWLCDQSSYDRLKREEESQPSYQTSLQSLSLCVPI